MNILFATPECAPWIKTGGLGDVCGALPKALHALGHEVRVLMPLIKALMPLAETAAQSWELPARAPWPPARLLLVRQPDLSLWLLDCPALYDRPCGPYVDSEGHDFIDNAERFGFLSYVAALLSSADTPCTDWPVAVLHAHDWTTALAPAYLSRRVGPRAATVLTIHNLLFQGNFPLYLAKRLDIPASWMEIERGLLHWDQLCFLKAGLWHSDMLTTVSPTYAREIQHEPEGCGLEGVLRLRNNDLVGILNGIDTGIWHPASDNLIPTRYDASSLYLKADNKAALQERMGLHADKGAMLLGLVSRLTSQKGIDLILRALPKMLDNTSQLCILGTGERELETELAGAVLAYPGRLAVHIGFDEELAHLIEAGADAFLMPSLFEPCGLSQMYSQAYGTPPIVHAVGGLADSVTHDVDGQGNGFSFEEPTTDAFLKAVRQAQTAYRDQGRWRRIQANAMALERGWQASALRYVEVYRTAIDHAAARYHTAA